MKTPFARFEGATQKVSDAADKATVVFRDSLTTLIVVGVVAVVALVLSTLAILSVKRDR